MAGNKMVTPIVDRKGLLRLGNDMGGEGKPHINYVVRAVANSTSNSISLEELVLAVANGHMANPTTNAGIHAYGRKGYEYAADIHRNWSDILKDIKKEFSNGTLVFPKNHGPALKNLPDSPEDLKRIHIEALLALTLNTAPSIERKAIFIVRDFAKTVKSDAVSAAAALVARKVLEAPNGKGLERTWLIKDYLLNARRQPVKG